MDALPLDTRLRLLIERRRQGRITLRCPSGTRIHGYPLLISRELVLVQELADFHFDGYAIAPIDNIRSIRCGKYERIFEHMLIKEGVYDRIGLTQPLMIGSFPDLFRSIQCIGDNAIIERRVGNDDEFYIGRVMDVADDSVLLLNFDATGHWDAKPTLIPYPEITLVRFDTEYIRVFSRYVH